MNVQFLKALGKAAVTSVGAADANSYDGIDSSTDLQISEGTGTAFIRQTTAADDTSSAIEGAQSAIATAKAINESTSSTGVTASVTEATFTVADAAGRFANTLNIDGTTNVLVINGQAVIVNLNGGSQGARRQQLVDAINSQVSGVEAEAGAGAADWSLTTADGRNISVRATGTGASSVGGELFGFTTAVTTESVVARGGITLQAGGDITTTFTDAAQVTGEGTATASGVAVSTVDISTIQGANTALLILDSVLDTISSARGDLGAVQNRLGSTIANLSIVVEKIAESRSRILDADFAQETAALTKAQILQQAGIAVLAQANAVPAAALALLEGAGIEYVTSGEGTQIGTVIPVSIRVPEASAAAARSLLEELENAELRRRHAAVEAREAAVADGFDWVDEQTAGRLRALLDAAGLELADLADMVLDDDEDHA